MALGQTSADSALQACARQGAVGARRKGRGGRDGRPDQTAASRSGMVGAGGLDASSCRCAMGWLRQHSDQTARAHDSHLPHWVATPSSSWMSSKPMPERAARAMVWSLTRWQTQTIMVNGAHEWETRANENGS